MGKWNLTEGYRVLFWPKKIPIRFRIESESLYKSEVPLSKESYTHVY